MPWLFFLMIGFFCLTMVLDRLFSYPVDEFDDLIALARLTDDLEVENLLDVRKEAELKATMPRKEFSKIQRKRIITAFEYLRRRAFNGSAITGLAHAEMSRMLSDTEDPPDMEKLYLLREILDAALQFRIYILAVLPKTVLWVLLRADKWPLVSPSVSDLREGAEIDGVAAYYRLTTAVGYLSLFYGERCYDDLMTKLRGRIPTI